MLTRISFLPLLLCCCAVILPGIPHSLAAGDSVVTFNEIMYHPATNEAALEWVELHSQMAVDVDISLWRLRSGISYDFPSNTIVPGGGYIVVASDPSALEAAHGISGIFGPFDGRLSNAGEGLRLRNHDGRIMDELDYNDRGQWPSAPDGSGVSLAKIEEDMGTADSANWAPSHALGGTPGAANMLHLPGASPLVFNEISGVTNSPFWVELVNTATTNINVGGYRVAVNGFDDGSYTLPSQVLSPGGFLVIYDSALGLNVSDENKLFLYAPSDSFVMDATLAQTSARARYPDQTGPWLRPDATTPGATNQVSLSLDVVINEIMYHHQPVNGSYAESNEEWIELHNRGTMAVDLAGWELDDGVAFDFPSNTTIAAGGFVVVAEDTNLLATAFPDLTNIVGEYSGSLANGGERILLRDANGNPADEVRYYDGYPWPESADGQGSSLELIDADADNATASAWAGSDEIDKSTWQTLTYRGVATSDGIGYDIWHEFCVCLLGPGEVLIDDISVVEDPDGSATPFMQNGTFESDSLGNTPAAWRLLGTHGSHGRSVVVDDPVSPGNHVLHLVSTGDYKHWHNHAETTFANNEQVVAGQEYEISFRAKWLTGSPQLNTRLYFNWLQRTTVLTTPQTNGTPGHANSRLAANTGPTYSDLEHSPVIPANGESVEVSVTATDPDGIGELWVMYSIDEGAWQSNQMASAVGGQYTGTIPGQDAAALVQFYVTGRDGVGTSSACPVDGVDSRAMYSVEDGQANLGAVHNLRIVMTDSERDAMYVATELMSNYRRRGTAIYDERLVYYDVGIRLKGSPAGRAIDSAAGLNIEFPTANLFRGVHRTISVERGDSMREVLAKHMFSAAGGGLASLYDDAALVIMPRPSDTGRVLLSMARYTDVFLDGWLENGSDGNDFLQEALYTPTGTVDGNPESLKKNTPYTQTSGVLDLDDYGSDKETYRWNFQLRNKRRRDDYSGMISVCQALALAGDTLDAESRDVLDVSQWMRTFAMQSLVGNDDTYSRIWEHNFRMIQRPSDGLMLAMPWDLDRSFNLATSAALWGGDNIQNLIELPGNRRLFYGHALDMIETTCNRGYMTYWTGHYGSLLDENLNACLDEIEGRSDYFLSQIPLDRNTFTVTNANFAVDTDYAVIGGQAGIEVHEIYLDGLDLPLETWWTRQGSGTAQTFFWQATVPVAPGANTLEFEAIGFQGQVIGTDSAQVSSTVSERPVYDYLRVSELMYNPAEDGGLEFIELHNRGQVTLDLAGVRLAEGVTFDFASGLVTNLSPGAYVLIVRDLSVFAAYYNTNGLLIAGEYAGGLANGGERVSVHGEYGDEIVSLEYDDGRGWPLAADGAGHALVATEFENQPTGSLNYGGNWRASAYIDGSPGEADPEPVDDVLLNEIAAHTDYTNAANPEYDSNDWLELYNTKSAELFLADWYLSDSASDLKKWAIPSTNTIPAQGWRAFDEVSGFHSPITSGFGLNKAGEQVFLSYLPGTADDRVADCVRFKGQKNGATLGRYTDGDDYWYTLSPTQGTTNELASARVVISQLMYHPRSVGTNASDNTDHEYIVIQNDGTNQVELWNAVGPWRIDGIGYTLPSNTVIETDETLTIVPFDPADAVAVSNFLAAHNLLGTLPILLGPHDGKLSNTGERLALERPQAPDAEGESISWIIVDEVIYSSMAPWPDASANGSAIHRIDLRSSGNNPANWNVPHGADYQHPDGTLGSDGKIDADEAGRILIYMRAGQYFNVPVDDDYPDGYSPLSGTQTTPHPADYQHPNGTPGADWKIDADEAGRALIFMRAGEYYQVPVSESYPDGYAPGAP